MKSWIFTALFSLLVAAGAYSQDEEPQGPAALGSTRADLLSDIGKPLDEIKDKATLKGLYESILVTIDPTQEQPTAVLYFLKGGVSVDFVIMTFYTPAKAKAIPADKEAMDATVTEAGFEAQDVPGLPPGQALYYNSDSEEFVYLADDKAAGNVKVIFLAYTADNATLGPLGQVIPGVIAKVQKDLKL
jgi:hypothetical protein